MPDGPHLHPPLSPGWLVPRPRLFIALQQVFHHRLSLVVAGPGFGKTTALVPWAVAMGCAWYTATAADASLTTFARGLAAALRARLPALRPDLEAALPAGGGRDDPARAELMASVICDALDPLVTVDLPIVIDAAESLGDGASARLIDAIRRQAPPALHVLLVSRTPPPAVLARGAPVVLGPDELSFSLEETRAVVTAAIGASSPDQAEHLHERSAGWPAAVRLAVDALQRHHAGGGAVHADRGSEDPFSALADEMLRDEPPEVARLLSTMAPFDAFSPALCEHLGFANARSVLSSLARRGMFVQHDDGSEEVTVHVLLREHARKTWPVDPATRVITLVRASGWFLARGELEDALDALSRTDDQGLVATFLRLHGEELIARGSIQDVLEAAERLAPDAFDTELHTILGWARRLRGDWVEAFDHYRRGADRRSLLPARLAWRLAEAHYLRAELHEAAQVAERVDLTTASEHDRAMLFAWHASALRRMGERERALPLAQEARRIAERTGDATLIATTFTTELGVVEPPKDDPLRRKRTREMSVEFEAAERCGNAWIRVRLLANQAEHWVLQGHPEDAIEPLEVALRVAESSGDPINLGRTLEIRALAALRQGRLAEAIDDAKVAGAHYERAGSRMLAQTLLILAHAHRDSGELAAATRRYEEAFGIGARTDNAEITGEALAGLVRLAARNDPPEARRLGEQARAIAGVPSDVRAQVALAVGWAALANGEREDAATLAAEVRQMAELHEYRARAAEAMELAAMAASEPAVEDLEHAVRLWRDAGDVVGEARATYAVSRLRTPGEGATDVAARRLRRLGVRLPAAAGAAGLLAALPPVKPPPVEVRTLGGFAVLRDGVPVPFSEWKSRKARDLLKILVARRGTPTHREFLMETLWPDERPEPLSNRLSVALAILRSVLDPERRPGPHPFITAEGDTVRLNVDLLSIDAEHFLEVARTTLRHVPDSPSGWLPSREDVEDLEEAEALYPGDFLEEDPYEDWATPLREEAKAVYVQVARALATAGIKTGRFDATVRYGLKILARDPYDEVAHLLIVRALAAQGSHGEARRRYRMYVAAVDDIGVAPASYPGATAA